jgi:hypothetical protein
VKSTTDNRFFEVLCSSINGEFSGNVEMPLSSEFDWSIPFRSALGVCVFFFAGTYLVGGLEHGCCFFHILGIYNHPN